MKAKIFSSLIGLILLTNIHLSAQKRVTVEAVNNDISYYLDLKAVAYIFGESDNLEDFEYRLNDLDNNISNLDLNSDGYIDYLRVIEVTENNVHLVVIQAVLDRDVYQDIATIVVERDKYRRTTVQIIGDSYLYGSNYIIEPYYYRTPGIFSWFWTSRYKRWYSPYYWGYYPRYYSYRHPIEINLYLSHINNRIYQHNHYRYSEKPRYNNYEKLHSSVRRNDFGTRHPEKNFSNRNNDVPNKSAFEGRRGNNSRSELNNNENRNNGSTRNSTRNSENSVRNNSNQNINTERRNEYNSGANGSNRTIENNTRTNSNRTNENTRINTGNGRSVEKNSQNSELKTRGNTTVTRPENRVADKNENRSSNTIIQQPSPVRSTQERTVNKPIENTRNNTVKTVEPQKRVERSATPATQRQEPAKVESKERSSSRTNDSNNRR